MSNELKKIMLVDDDELVSEFALMILKNGGLDVLYCDSGETAIARVREFRPQLVLLDFIMPGMSGVETLQSLQDMPETKNTPVVYLTGYAANDGDEEAMTTIGAAGVIRKPFEPNSLLPAIEDIWQRHVA